VINDRIHEAISGGVEYMLARQFPDGHWEDYELPVGRSDQWVTAFVGLALAGLQQTHPSAVAGALRGAAWLLRRKTYRAGWGFNAQTGPDADSTAYVLVLLNTFGWRANSEDVALLLERWRNSGGFATYDGPCAWGVAHPDVTPQAFRALPPDQEESLRPSLTEYLCRSRRTDGTWPAYWWRACHYSTYMNFSLMLDLKMNDGISPLVVLPQEQYAVHSSFDLAYVLGLAVLHAGASKLADGLAVELLGQQQADGGWPGGKNLRVTDPTCFTPWVRPAGKLYLDTNALITTASAVQVLARLAGMRNNHIIPAPDCSADAVQFANDDLFTRSRDAYLIKGT
jgi:hypothetical protein